MASALDTTGGEVTNLELVAGRNMTISQPVKAAGDVTLLAGGISGTPFDPTGSMTINAPVTSTTPQGLVTIQGEGGISIGTGGVLTANTIALFSF